MTDRDDVRRLLDSLNGAGYRLLIGDPADTIRSMCEELIEGDLLYKRLDASVEEIYAQVPDEGELDDIVTKLNGLLDLNKPEMIEGIEQAVELVINKDKALSDASGYADQVYRDRLDP